MNQYDIEFSSLLCNAVMNITHHGEGTLYANSDSEIMIQTQFLYDIFNEIKPKRILEIGTAYAHFDYFVLDNFDFIERITTIDLFPASIEAINILNKKYGNKIDFFHGNSIDILSKIISSYDIVWVDGGHHFNECMSDLNNCKRLNIPHILIDDSQGEVWQAINIFMTENNQYKLIRQSKDNRIITYLRKD